MKKYEQLGIDIRNKDGFAKACDICPKIDYGENIECSKYAKDCNVCMAEYLFAEVEEKKEPVYRPYKDTDEMVADWCSHFNQKINLERRIPLIWLHHKHFIGSKELITAFEDIGVRINGDWHSLETLFTDYAYLDGTPVGKLVE